MQELSFELCMGRRVRDQRGRNVGRLNDARAERDGDRFVIVGYRIGAAAFFQRLAASIFGILPLRGYEASPGQLDVSNPERPVLTCPVELLRKFSQRRPPKKESR